MATQRGPVSEADAAIPAGGGVMSAAAVRAGVRGVEGVGGAGGVEPSLLKAARLRSVRVLTLVAGIVILSLADLDITITYLRTVGMGEANPVARYVMEHGSPSLLILWKCASVLLACVILVRYRTRLIAEAASWFSFAVLVWLLLRWSAYADEVWHLTPALHSLPDSEAAMWVQMGE